MIDYYRIPEIITKHKDDEYFVDFDFAPFLSDEEDISDAAITITNKDTGEDLTEIIGGDVEPEISSGSATIKVWLEGGEAGKDYLITVVAETSSDQKFALIATLQVGPKVSRY